MSGRATLFQMWANNPKSLNMTANELADKVGISASSIPVYRGQFKRGYKQLSPESKSAGKRLRNNEARRKWIIEEAVAKLRAENASMDEIVAYWRAA